MGKVDMIGYGRKSRVITKAWKEGRERGRDGR